MSRRAGAAGGIAGAVAAAVLLTGFGPPPDPGGFSDADLARSISPLTLNVDDLQRNVQSVATTTKGLVTLNTDVLFAFGKADLSERARQGIADALDDIPRKATVQVGGHTDSIGSTASNQRLSEQRAKAVAAAVRSARPDLKLQVRGYGEGRPVASNTSGGKDDPVGRAKNRRVELRYQA